MWRDKAPLIIRYDVGSSSRSTSMCPPTSSGVRTYAGNTLLDKCMGQRPSGFEMTISSKTSPIYLLAGIYGEKSDFEEFRRTLPSSIPTEIIELQSLNEPVAQLTDMKAIGVALGREIDRLSPEGCIRLAGFSFGGTAVFEAARYLIDSGRSICFLGL